MRLLGKLARFSHPAYMCSQASAHAQLYKAFKPPLAALVTCMDGRLLPSRLFKAEGGELMVLRNPGNFVPHAKTCDPSACEDGVNGGTANVSASGEMAGLQLAIQKMALPDIIVCGHSECRAGEALRNLAISSPTGISGSGSQHSLDLLNNWLEAQGTATLEKYERYAENRTEDVKFERGGRKGNGIEATIDEENVLTETDQLAQINVLQQLEHLQSYDFIRSRVETDQVRLHATFYELHTSSMYIFNYSQRRFVLLPTDDITSLTHFISQLRACSS